MIGFIFLVSILSFNVKRLATKVDRFLLNPRAQIVQVWFVALVLLGGILFLCTPDQRLGEALYQRLLPLVGLSIALALQVLVGQFLWTGNKLNFSFIKGNVNELKIYGFVLSIFLFIWLMIAWSGIGIKRGPSGWLSPGTPVLPQQLFLCVLIGLFFFIFRSRFDKYTKGGFLPAVTIWLVASVVWWSEPLVRQSYFNPTPTPPNFEYYPYSDAFHYDWFAQNLLIGNSRNIGLTHRPLYSILLALLHFMVGAGLKNVIFMQVIILAAIPALVYLLVSRLGNRPAGVIAALILIARERNSIALTNIIEVSHVKLIMSDVSTMLTMVLFIYFFVRWFQEREDKYVFGVFAGASLGLSIFIRGQAQLLVPIALAGIILIEKFKWRSILQKAAVFLLGAAVVVVPWVWRNYQLTGRVLVEYLDFYTTLIASTYSSTPDDSMLRLGESGEQYRDRVKGQVINYIVDHPVEVSYFYTSYFLHNEITSLTYLPMSPRFYTIYQYVDTVGFWDSPYLSDVPIAYLPSLFLIICLVALGISVVFKRFGLIGIMPLLFHLGYSFSSVPVRQSGWRFILPVDWVVVLYFCIGLTEFGLLLYSLISKKSFLLAVNPVMPENARPVSWRGTRTALACFALMGIAIPLIEWSIPERYPALPNDALIQHQLPNGLVLESGEKISTLDLENFVTTEAGATVLYGRALYPSYYEQGESWGDSNAQLLEASQYTRLQFSMIGGGSNSAFVLIPLQEPPQYFPHASDVFVVGCSQDASVRALITVVNGRVLVAAPWYGLTCSVTE